MGLIEKLSKKALRNDAIGRDLFAKHGIKRGLRNEDGTGVKTDITNISDVIGYEQKDGRVIPVEGRLIYRGIEINKIVNGFLNEKRYGFEETAYLLMFGENPTKTELMEFSGELANQRALPEGFLENIILPFPSKDIMNKLQTNVTVLYRTDLNPDDISLDNVVKQCISLVAKFPTMIAYSYQAKRHNIDGKSLFIHKPNGSKSTAESFLYMLREDMNFTLLEAQVLDMMLILHADHGGGNNSTFTTRCVTSTDTDTYSAIAAALGSLKGPKHGGANAEVMGMMDEIKKNVRDWKNDDEVADYLQRIVQKEKGDGSGLIYGIGHAVYTTSDPRAVLLEQKARELVLQLRQDKSDELNLYLKVAGLAPNVLREVNRTNKTVAPNVDFFSGFVYDCLRFPPEIYTPLFAMARVAGWSAHRIEEIVSGGKIIRPASVYVGPQNRSYIPLAQRG